MHKQDLALRVLSSLDKKKIKVIFQSRGKYKFFLIETNFIFRDILFKINQNVKYIYKIYLVKLS